MRNYLWWAVLSALFAPQTAVAQFDPLCPGQITSGYVVDFAEYEGSLYVTGLFGRICNKLAKSIVRWDGTTWQTLTNSGVGTVDAGHALEVIGGKLYLAKYEWNIDSNWLVRIENNTMRKVYPGFYRTNPNPNLNQVPILYDVVEYKQQIIVSGEFDRAGNQVVRGVARYANNTWQPLGEGLSGYLPNTYDLIAPHGMLVWNDNLYVAGNFLKAGSVTANGVAQWDGTEWHAMGAGFDKAVYGFGSFQGALYACGEFTASGNTPLNGIAKWDGTAWVDPGFGLVRSDPNEVYYVHSLRTIGDKLYVLGGFKKAVIQGDTLDCSAIVAFDGTKLDVLGGGVPNFDAEAIIPYKQGILVGGGIVNGSSGYIATYGVTTDVAAPEPEAAWEVFPNPVSDRLSIRSKEMDVFSFVLTDALGQIVLTGKSTAALDLSEFAPGVYFLSIETLHKRMAHKVIRR